MLKLVPKCGYGSTGYLINRAPSFSMMWTDCPALTLATRVQRRELMSPIGR